MSLGRRCKLPESLRGLPAAVSERHAAGFRQDDIPELSNVPPLEVAHKQGHTNRAEARGVQQTCKGQPVGKIRLCGEDDYAGDGIAERNDQLQPVPQVAPFQDLDELNGSGPAVQVVYAISVCPHLDSPDRS